MSAELSGVKAAQAFMSENSVSAPLSPPEELSFLSLTLSFPVCNMRI